MAASAVNFPTTRGGGSYLIVPEEALPVSEEAHLLVCGDGREPEREVAVAKSLSLKRQKIVVSMGSVSEWMR